MHRLWGGEAIVGVIFCYFYIYPYNCISICCSFCFYLVCDWELCVRAKYSFRAIELATAKKAFQLLVNGKLQHELEL
jgi:hypothetical protein